jgi:hypothetical protein
MLIIYNYCYIYYILLLYIYSYITYIYISIYPSRVSQPPPGPLKMPRPLGCSSGLRGHNAARGDDVDIGLERYVHQCLGPRALGIPRKSLGMGNRPKMGEIYVGLGKFLGNHL